MDPKLNKKSASAKKPHSSSLLNKKPGSPIVKYMANPAPPKLQNHEKACLDMCISLNRWEFKVLFLEKCIEISSSCLSWDINDTETEILVYIYGMKAQKKYKNKPDLSAVDVISNFFVWSDYDDELYQSYSLEGAVRIRDLVEKKFLYENYETIKKFREKNLSDEKK